MALRLIYAMTKASELVDCISVKSIEDRNPDITICLVAVPFSH